MNIKILKNEIDNEKINSINAEELHKSLEIKDNYKTWIKRRIKKYEFIENTDYILVSQNCETNNPKNRNTTINNYIITIDMAKELAMVQNNEKGREIRKYFIEIEKEFRKKEKMKYLEFEKENEIKSKIYESFFKNGRMLRISDVSSILDINSNKLFAFLRKKNILNII